MYKDQPHVFQLLFSNKSTSRAMKNLAAFVRDVTNSPAASENADNRESYVTDRIVTVKEVSPQGKVKDITEEVVDNFTEAEWQDWESRLSRSSIKERMDDVTVAYSKFMEDTKENTSASVGKTHQELQ